MTQTPELEARELREMYRTMVLIREAEERLLRLFSQNRMPGFIHSYLGEEAVAVGVCSALNADDYITSTHRGHGHILAKGGDLKLFFAELYGKETGYCKGKGGSMHVADLDLGILGANGIVGGGIAIAGGAALAAQMTGNGRVAVSFMGDGATDIGSFHESLNLGALWDVPAIFVVENNGYADFIAQRDHQKIERISDRAAAYGMPGVTVDGNDVEEVLTATQAAVDRARSGNGPTLIEAVTYRWRGHFEGDPQPYRTQDEVATWKAKDPLLRTEARLRDLGALDDRAKEQLISEVQQLISEAVQFAEDSPMPSADSVLQDVYTDLVVEGRK
ncbi:MAG: thiamine pyrophosphate-dependent dehydrogenase E1 component subunit alpha [Cryobacterium sp.]|nr:thiamine pyrophosphate-dependent dehydrogenase E1 component subunit alpha [Cryobacterium sp.]